MPSKPPLFTNRATREARAATQQAANARGNEVYNGEWRRMRRRHLQDHPLCVFCLASGLAAAATVVDHRVPVQVDPSRRLDPANFRSCCASHHAQLSRNFQRTGKNELPER